MSIYDFVYCAHLIVAVLTNVQGCVVAPCITTSNMLLVCPPSSTFVHYTMQNCDWLQWIFVCDYFFRMMCMHEKREFKV